MPTPYLPTTSPTTHTHTHTQRGTHTRLLFALILTQQHGFCCLTKQNRSLRLIRQIASSKSIQDFRQINTSNSTGNYFWTGNLNKPRPPSGRMLDRHIAQPPIDPPTVLHQPPTLTFADPTTPEPSFNGPVIRATSYHSELRPRLIFNLGNTSQFQADF